jgi:DNA-binding NtrC family response regulator
VTKPKILVVDDKKDLARGVALTLSEVSDKVVEAYSAEDALEKLQRAPYDIVFTDIRMPGMDGVELLKKIKTSWPACRVILLTAFASIRSAVDATKLGAYDYIAKPFEPDDLLLVARRAIKDLNDEIEITRLRAELKDKHTFEGIVSRDRRMLSVFDTIRKVAPSSVAVLVRGESGTGKELVVRAIHGISQRNDKAFVAFNAAAVPEGLAEAELFGSMKGAFTGAERDSKGLLEVADGGTLFIDELSSMPLSLQGKLLRALQEQEVMPVGATKPIPVDVRVISAVNVDPMRLIREGKLRQDLYYRLAVVRISIPPLRERVEDIPLLAQLFLEHATDEDSGPRHLAAAAKRVLMCHDWPGNVRELRNVVERAALMSSADDISAGDIVFEDDQFELSPCVEGDSRYEVAKRRVLEQFQYRYVERLLTEHQGNVSAASRAAGITRAAFHRILKRLEIEPRSFGA